MCDIYVVVVFLCYLQVVRETEQVAQQVVAEVNGEGKGGAAAVVTVKAEVEDQKEKQTMVEEGKHLTCSLSPPCSL